MTKISLFVASFLMLTTTVGCGGGNSGAIQTNGVRCNADGTSYDPIPLDKAGAYNIQEYNGVEKIEGEFQNVMGLPIKRIIAEIKKWK